jgi:ACS family tartrate transporter-like MFS transporter
MDGMTTREDEEPAALQRRVERKLTLRLILPIALITLINSIDRVNISYAGSAMSADLGLSPSQFGQGVSLFFIAYLLFQYPHVRLLRSTGIKPWILVSMVLWGCSGLWLAYVRSAGEFYAARFLLGMAEAGFAPGMTWLISQWAPPSLRARALAGVLVAVPVSMVLGGPLCGWLLGLGNTLQMESWRFMFLMLAIPNFVLAIAAAVYLVDSPAKARWLTVPERAWLDEEFRRQGEAPGKGQTLAQLARNPWLWRCCITWLLVMTGSYALVFWLPQLVRQSGLGTSEFMIGTLSALPLLALAIGLLANGRRSDSRGERLLHTGVPSALAGIALLVAAWLEPGWPVLALLCLGGLGIGAAQGVFWTVPGSVRIGGERVPVGAIALISMFGTAGGIIGPWLIGVLLDATGTFSIAIAILASLLILALPVIALGGTMRARTSVAPARPDPTGAPR